MTTLSPKTQSFITAIVCSGAESDVKQKLLVEFDEWLENDECGKANN
jgi:hypothetical protein